MPMNLPRSAYGTLFAHFGIGMLVIGIVATSAYREEHILVMKPGQSLVGRRLRPDVHRCRERAVGRTTARTSPTSTSSVAAQSVDASHALETALRCSAAADDGSRHSCVLARRSLRRHRRPAAGWRLRRQGLFQSARPLHLARRADHVHRRRHFAFRPAPSRRCAGSIAAASRGSGGVGAMRRLLVIGSDRDLDAVLRRHRRLCRAAERNPARSGARKARPGHLRGAALSRLPKPVDRRQRCAACRRFAPLGARAPRGP